MSSCNATGVARRGAQPRPRPRPCRHQKRPRRRQISISILGHPVVALNLLSEQDRSHRQHRAPTFRRTLGRALEMAQAPNNGISRPTRGQKRQDQPHIGARQLRRCQNIKTRKPRSPPGLPQPQHALRVRRGQRHPRHSLRGRPRLHVHARSKNANGRQPYSSKRILLRRFHKQALEDHDR